MICTRCGAMNSDGALFCLKCGNRLEVRNDNPMLSLPTSPYEQPQFTNYGSADAPYSPPPLVANPGNRPVSFNQSPNNNRGMYLIIITVLVIMLIGAGFFVGILLGKSNFQPNAGNTQSITNVTPAITSTATPVLPSPTPTHTLSTFTQAPLSDGRLQAWQSAPHAHWIQTRWIYNGQWTAWVPSSYPPSDSGVSGLYSFIKQDITYFEVWLDDGSCWQIHKLSTWSNDNWTPFYPC